MNNRWIAAFSLAALTLSACRPAPPIAGNEHWQALAPMVIPSSEGGAVLIDGVIYLAGGFSDERRWDLLQSYDPIRQRGKRLADLPGERHHAMATAFDGQLYVIGGAQDLVDPGQHDSYIALDNVWVYDPSSDTWSERAPMIEPRWGGDAVALGDYIYLAGGAGSSDALLRYDPAADTWTKLGSLNVSREHVAVAALDGRIYVTGGRWPTYKTMSTVEVYDPAADTWKVVAPMLQPRSGHAMITAGGRLIVSGGEVQFESPYSVPTVEAYDPATDTWTYLDDMPLPLHGHAMFDIGGTIYVIGGSPIPNRIQNAGAVFAYQLGGE